MVIVNNTNENIIYRKNYAKYLRLSKKRRKGKVDVPLDERHLIDQALISALNLNKQIQTSSIEGIMQYCIEEGQKLTQSQIGFFHFVSDDQKTIHLKVWSHGALEHCMMPPHHNRKYDVEAAGVWADCIKTKEPIIHNDYPDLPNKKGLPKGHVPVIREATVPILDDNKVVAIIGVGNKETDYDEMDIHLLSLLAENVWFAVKRKQIEKERETLLESLSEKTKTMQKLLSIVSHDLRSPLINIRGFSEFLAIDCKAISDIVKDLNVDKNVKDAINQITNENIPSSNNYIHTCVEKMDSLLESLSKFSNIGRVEIQIESLDMNKIVKDVITAQQFHINKLNTIIEYESLPYCLGDNHLINQVFSNLMVNALKYLSPDRQGHIKITGKVHNLQSIYCIEDNGIGISKDNQNNIFDLFYRVDPDSAVTGEGLGLATVKEILSRNNGKIWVESELDKGSKFFISLPNE